LGSITPLITLLHATRGRAEKAAEARRLWLNSAKFPEQIEHIFAFDRDDSLSVNGLAQFRHVVVEERDKGCVAAWNLAASSSSGKMLIQLSDDWLPVSNWDDILAGRFRDLNKAGVLRISDGRRVDDLLCMAIFTRPWLDQLGGNFLSPEYFGVYSDDEFSFRAYEAGVVIDARDIVFTHVHPNYEVAIPLDETHRRQNDSARLTEGKKIFYRRNPGAVDRWIHEWTDARYYLPCGHLAFRDPKFKETVISNKVTQQRIKSMESSLSWRLTRPIRWLSRLIQNEQHAVERSEKVSFVRRIYMACPSARWLKRRIDAPLSKTLSLVSCFASSKSNKISHASMVVRRQRPCADRVSSTVWPLVDVSFVTFNSARWIQPLFDSLLAQAYPLDKLNLTFVDNGSTDGTLDILEKLQRTHGHLTNGFAIIRQPNTGYGPGHHRAITSSSHPWLLVSNVDVEFRKQTITKLVSTAVGDHPSFAGWEPRQAPFEHPKHYDPVSLESSWQSHACALLRRSAYEAAGGYDPLIFMYGEDVELSYRLRSHDYHLRYCPEAVVVHHSYVDSQDLSKPLQLAGNCVGNTLLRLRYGSPRDRMVGMLLLAYRCLFPGRRIGPAAKTLRKESVKLCLNLRHFLSGKGPTNAGFPIRFFDYELRREGATWRAIEVREAPLISIITRTHGGEGRNVFLEQAGASVVNQTYKHLEWVVVEDGGATRGPVVERLQSASGGSLNATFISSDAGGRSVAGNLGLERSLGEFCVFLDDDDLLYADHVETLLSAIQSKQSKAAYALAFEVKTSFETNSYTEESFATASMHTQPWDYEVLKDHNFIPIQALLFSRALFAERGGFDTSLDQLEDWNLWLRYGFGNTFEYVPKTTSLFRTPADERKREARQEALHKAYFQAREAAFAALRALGHHM